MVKGVLLSAALIAALIPAPVTGQEDSPPNLLVIVTDDQRHDTLVVMPSVLSNFNLDFPTGIVNTPNCCPSRATIMTGEYSRNHGVINNASVPVFEERHQDSLGPWLQELGYRTGFVGKYLNKGVTQEGELPPGWDEFHGITWNDGGRLITNGGIYESFALRHYDGKSDEAIDYPNEEYPDPYQTRVLTEFADDFIHRSNDMKHNPQGKPWALFVFPFTPHYPYVVEPRHRGAPVPGWDRPPSYMEEDMSDKPRQVRRSRMRNRRHGGLKFWQIRVRQLRMLLSVDDLVEQLWSTVDDLDQLPDTWGIYTSDNGESWGEHRLGQKLHAYEESIRVPFRMRVPGAEGSVSGIVSNVDIAPTLLAIAGGEERGSFDGRSLLPVIRGDEAIGWRQAFIENPAMGWSGIRNPGWKYVRWANGAEELYNLRRDPYEMRNAAGRNKVRLRSLRRIWRSATS